MTNWHHHHHHHHHNHHHHRHHHHHHNFRDQHNYVLLRHCGSNGGHWFCQLCYLDHCGKNGVNDDFNKVVEDMVAQSWTFLESALDFLAINILNMVLVSNVLDKNNIKVVNSLNTKVINGLYLAACGIGLATVERLGR